VAAAAGVGRLLLLATRHDTQQDRLLAGQALSAVLLQTTDAGLASCTLSQPVEHARIRDELTAILSHGSAVPRS
jgi:hypothetical protein